jgi:hypothetical protein
MYCSRKYLGSGVIRAFFWPGTNHLASAGIRVP